MKKVTVTIISILVLIAAIMPFTVKYWPPSHTQALIILWLNESDWIDLLELADKTPYKGIMWGEPDFVQVVARVENDIHLEEEPEISELISAAREYGISFFSFQYYRGHWHISGLYESWINNLNQAEIEVVHVFSYYQYGGELVGKQCSKKVIEAKDTGQCYTELFGDWVLYKEWITVQSQLYDTNE